MIFKTKTLDLAKIHQSFGKKFGIEELLMGEPSLVFFLNILLIMLLQLSHFSPFTPLHPPHPLPPTFPCYSSCPWVILTSSLASTFPTLFLPSPRLFFTYHLCFLFPVPLPLLSPSHSPVDNPPCDLHFRGSVSVLVVCLVFFCFGFRCVCS